MGHNHNHTHAHHHHPTPDTLNSLFIIAITLNLAYTIIQALFALYAHSMGLLADAGHNLGDVLGLLLAWGANWLLTKPANQAFSYGYKRTSILAAIANAMILVIACALIIYGSIEKLLYPHPIKAMTVVVVALIGIVINASTALLFMRGSHEDLNLKGAFLHLASDALVSAGVVVAAIIIYYTGALWLDPVVGLVIVAIILFGTWGLFYDSIKLMLDGVPKQIDHDAVKNYFENLPGVKAVHDLHIWGLSTRDNALTIHLIMPSANLTDADHQNIRKDMLETFKISHVTVQVEQGSETHPCHQCE